MLRCLASVLLLSLAPLCSLGAQPTIVRAVQASSPIRVDGKLDEPAWAAAPAVTGFVQRDPDEGQPGSQRTEIRMAFGSDALYIGARMYDTDPRRIRARLARRDEPIFNADDLEIFLDSQNDGLSGYVFRITPAGAVRDAAIDANLNQDNSWDAVWESAATVDSLGWSAEMRIPFGQLRYNTGATDTVWGISVLRVIGRRGEYSYLPARPKNVAQSPAHWAKLAGLHDLPRSRPTEVTPYVNSRAEYLGRVPGNPFRTGSDYRVGTGVDLRRGLTNSLTLSATINPDFGQVEVDPARINLTQNELFFPERRPFFVERADVFRFGQVRTAVEQFSFDAFRFVPVRTIFNPSNFEPFHSRRIGRTPQRELSGDYTYVDIPDEVSIAGAAKLTGRTSRGLTLGLLDAVTTRERARVIGVSGSRRDETVEPETNYLLMRGKQEFNRGNTVIGGLLTGVNRRLDDPAIVSILRRAAYFTGLDLQQSWRRREWSLDAAWGASLVQGSRAAIAATQRSSVRYLQRPDRTSHRFDPSLRDLNGTMWHVAAAKNAGVHWLGHILYREISPGLEVNDIGFQTTAGFRLLSWSIAYKDDVPRQYLRTFQLRPYGYNTGNWDRFRGRDAVGSIAEVVLPNFWQVSARGERVHGRLESVVSRGGPITRRPDADQWELAVTSDRRKSWTTRAGLLRETEDIGSWTKSVAGSLDWRPFSQLRVNFEPAYSDRKIVAQYVTQFADPAATLTYGRRYVFGTLRYHELTFSSRTDWTFSPTLSLQLFLQPLIAVGSYSDFKSLQRPRTLDFDHWSEANGTLARAGRTLVLLPGGPAFRIANPDFKSRTLLGNAVARWEYRPGSALFLVWQQRRNGVDQVLDLVPGKDLRAILRDRPENVIAVKATYWIQL